jgi:hypothetical protein
MRYFIGIIITIVAALTVTPAFAYGPASSYEPVRIEIIAEDGSMLAVIPFSDFRNGSTQVIKKYLEARKGLNYSIAVRNMTAERVGVVIAVDGRNIISGKQSDLKNSEQMYVIEGNGYARLDGWRTDDSTVHKFYFTTVPDSYSARTFNDTSAMGVIAMAAYREKEKPRPVYRPYKSGNAPAPATVEKSMRSKAATSRDESAGTGFGDAQYAPVVRVEFEPETSPLVKTLVKYEWREVLCKKRLLACGQERGNRLWDDSSYAPFPPGYSKR